MVRKKEISIITSISTLLSSLPSPNHVSPLNKLAVGDTFIPELVIESINKSGYVREDFVSIHGQYAIRGSVMDIFLTS